MSPPFVVTCEKALDAFTGELQRFGPLVEQRATGGRERVGALAVGPHRRDEALLLERAQQPVEVPHLDALLARQLGQALEEVVAVGRPLAEEQQQRRLGEALDARENAPPAAV